MRIRGTIRFLLENSLFLILGAVAGLIWANLDHASYEHFLHLPLLETTHIGYEHDGHRVITLHYLVNDLLMALFFAIAGKEVWEATLPGGPLNKPRQAANPLFATAGGVLVPAGVYLLGAAALGQLDVLGTGWAVPCATDIAFSYLVARLIFGSGHPAIPFLLLLAIADDAIGLIIIAVFYPQEEVRIAWLLLAVAGMLVGFIFRRLRIRSFWPYLVIGGALSMYGFIRAGLHPVLGLLPIIPTMPHAHVDTGLFDWKSLEERDTLNRFEHWWNNPVEIILGLFGLLNAGVVFSAIGNATYLVLAGLLIGKPLGIWGFGIVADKLGFKAPEGIRGKELFVIGCAAAIGFTVALFVATVAFPPGAAQDAAKMGALFSFGAAILTFAAARLVGIQKMAGESGGPGH